ncbi:MAG: hypothetical protein ABI990_02575, partial [Actinomycetota bacterium]
VGEAETESFWRDFLRSLVRLECRFSSLLTRAACDGLSSSAFALTARLRNALPGAGSAEEKR